MPLRSIVNTAHALSYYTRRQEIAANNLATYSSDCSRKSQSPLSRRSQYSLQLIS